MGLRYSKRIGGNKGWGLNVSGSGISSSYRSKYGSFGSRGYSVRTGIPGLTFRGGWGGRRSKNASGIFALVMLAITLVSFASYILFTVIKYAIQLLFWAGKEGYFFVRRIQENRRADNQSNSG